jgi:tetratricopeptide (TPR) repeat protein
LRAAVSLKVSSGKIRLGVAVTGILSRAKIQLTAKGKNTFQTNSNCAPDLPFIAEIKLPRGVVETDLQLRVTDSSGQEIISYQPKLRSKGEVPTPATEPPTPEKIASADELFTTGLHLDQYRHATRCPTLYWREALRRDPLDSRCNNALGLWHLKRGEFFTAKKYFNQAIERLTRRNANPYDGEAYYHLGLCLRHLGRDDEAYDAFYKACWNQAWQSAAYHALAEIDCCRQDWSKAEEHLMKVLSHSSQNQRAANLFGLVCRERGNFAGGMAVWKLVANSDRLDWWTRHLLGEKLACDLQAALDIAHDFARAGFYRDAIKLLQSARFAAGDLPDQSWGANPLVQYTLGWLHQKLGDNKSSLNCFKVAAKLPPDYCFPARLEEIAILEAAIVANPKDAKAPYYLGNLFYDRRRHAEAIRRWEKSAKLDPNFSIVWRNLGIGYFNIRKNADRARTVYDKALRVNRADARLLYERDQLWKRLGEKPAKRLRELEKFPQLVSQRDDLTVEFCALYNQTGQPEKALTLVSVRNFQPWEGGEGGPLGQWVRSHLALGRNVLPEKNFAAAAEHFSAALTAPKNLGEAKHLLANQSDIHFWLGCALEKSSDKKSARKHWLAAANFKGDFQEMSVRAFSEMTFYSALSLEKLGQKAKAKKMFRELLAFARQLEKTEAKIDYFATSLPTMLLFDDDLSYRQATTALFLQAQARLGLGQRAAAKKLLRQVLQRDPNHSLANDLNHEVA